MKPRDFRRRGRWLKLCLREAASARRLIAAQVEFREDRQQMLDYVGLNLFIVGPG